MRAFILRWRAAIVRRVDADAVVVGAGVVGLSVGRALALRGQRILVLEGGPKVGGGG